MDACIILFSPSGNTLNVGNRLKTELEVKGIEVQLLNLTGNESYFKGTDRQEFLSKQIKPHDILFVGSPVYAHHFQYHMKDLIQSLPFPDEKWGKIAIPFVTYGGINSGISLDEAGELLINRGRIVIAGFKAAASHRMSRGFLDTELNSGLPEERLDEPVKKLVESILKGEFVDRHDKLKYQMEEAYTIANTVFVEKRCHESMYPKIRIDSLMCSNCRNCVEVCPVGHLERRDDGSVSLNDLSACIHCFNCVVECKMNAILLQGDLEKAKEFFNSMVANGMETPGTAVFPVV